MLLSTIHNVPAFLAIPIPQLSTNALCKVPLFVDPTLLQSIISVSVLQALELSTINVFYVLLIAMLTKMAIVFVGQASP